jgi:hypothetical protein
MATGRGEQVNVGVDGEGFKRWEFRYFNGEGGCH